MLNLQDEKGNFVASLYLDSDGNLNIVSPLVIIHKRDAEIQTDDGDSLCLDEASSVSSIESAENNFASFSEEIEENKEVSQRDTQEIFEFNNPMISENYDDNQVVQELIHRLMQINMDTFFTEDSIKMDSVD
jgi:hypothetical protein